MSSLDHMKIIEIISEIFDADYKVDLQTSNGREFEIETPMSNGKLLYYKMTVKKYEITLNFEKKYLNARNADKIIPELEYQLEQTYLKNIKIDFIDEKTKSLLHISV